MNFPISRQYIYFDSAKSSGMYKELLAWRKEHDNMLLEKGSQLRLNHDTFIDSLRTGLGSFFYTTVLWVNSVLFFQNKIRRNLRRV